MKQISLLSDYDAIVLPGLGGPRNSEEPTESLPVWVKTKLNRLIERYIREGTQTPIITLSAGSYHVPPVYDKTGRPITEASAMTLYLRKAGLTNIYEENASYDTVGNAFYLRSIHCETRGWKRLLIVVNDFHAERLSTVFDWIFSLSSEPSMVSRAELSYWIIPTDYNGTEGLELKEIIESRKEKEEKACASMRKTIDRLGKITWADFHHWFFNEHDLYRSNNREQLMLGNYPPEIDNRCRQSY